GQHVVEQSDSEPVDEGSTAVAVDEVAAASDEGPPSPPLAATEEAVDPGDAPEASHDDVEEGPAEAVVEDGSASTEPRDDEALAVDLEEHGESDEVTMATPAASAAAAPPEPEADDEPSPGSSPRVVPPFP